MHGPEAAGHLDRVARPIERGRLAQQGPARPIEEGADDAVLRVVVGGVRVLGHVHPGPAPHAAHQRAVVRLGEALQEDRRPGLAVVHPVEAGVELLVVHAVAAQRDLGRFRLGVLAEVAFHAPLVELQDAVVGAEGVQHRPVQEVLERVVGAVVAGPPGHAQQVAPVVEVALEELGAGLRLRVQQLPLEQRPVRGCDRRVDVDQCFPDRRSHRPRAGLGGPNSRCNEPASSSAIKPTDVAGGELVQHDHEGICPGSDLRRHVDLERHGSTHMGARLGSIHISAPLQAPSKRTKVRCLAQSLPDVEIAPYGRDSIARFQTIENDVLGQPCGRHSVVDDGVADKAHVSVGRKPPRAGRVDPAINWDIVQSE